jgi:putative flavoprotein involved in K+ transport
MADYLESYATRFALPVRTNARVERLSRRDGVYVVSTADRQFEAAHVVVAMSSYQTPRTPPFAVTLAPDIVQVHSSAYRSPAQLQKGGVLVVGAGNSGAEIAAEVAPHHRTWVSGRDTGQVPFDTGGPIARSGLLRFMFRVLFHRVLTVDTWIGRKARPAIVAQGGPLIRTKRTQLAEAGVEFVARMAGTHAGRPLLEDGRTLDVANVIWCTGFQPGFSWIDLPIFDEHGEPRHTRGVVEDEPGLYFVGLHFLYALSSTMIHGVGRDAARVVRAIEDGDRQRSAVGRRRSAGRRVSSTAAVTDGC